MRRELLQHRGNTQTTGGQVMQILRMTNRWQTDFPWLHLKELSAGRERKTIPRLLSEEKEGKGTFSKCLCCYDYCFYDPPVLLQRCDAEPLYFFSFFLRTITRLNTGCVTGQHTALVTFPPTQVELNTVEVIMLLFDEQFRHSALVSHTCVPRRALRPPEK